MIHRTRPSSPDGGSWDERVIERGIEAALREGRSIDDRTARFIAAQFHTGQTSALYSLASTGAIDESCVYDELRHDPQQQTDQARRWGRWLSGYCALRSSIGTVDGWNEQAAAQDQAEVEALRRTQTLAVVDELFGEQPTEEIGDGAELGWFGLVRHKGSPGGAILSEDERGFRHVWETDSDAELMGRWVDIVAE